MTKKGWMLPAALIGLAIIPAVVDPFYTRLASRVLVYGLCALSLDLILGYGGMVSLGHAAYLGLGAYTVGILSAQGIQSAWIAWPAAAGISAAAALVMGLVCLRTAGVYFIMITLAFAQMIFYLFAGLDAYGGFDGLPLSARSSLGGPLSLESNTGFYYVVLVLVLGMGYLGRRLTLSRFGRVITGIRENERRMQSIGFATFRYRLVCFVIAGAVAGLAGALLANLSRYVSPSMMHWTRSGEILMMVILGGQGTLMGPMLGAAGLILAEEILSGFTQHWMVILGPLLILVVLSGKGGIWRMITRGAGHA